MPIPGTDILTTAELAGQMISESRADTLAAADRARRAEVENDRLRELLAIARGELISTSLNLRQFGLDRTARRLQTVYHQSDPDATAAEASDAD